MKNSIKQTKNELMSTGNRAEQMEERISEKEGRNLEMMQRDERDFSIKIIKVLYDNYLNPSERAM